MFSLPGCEVLKLLEQLMSSDFFEAILLLLLWKPYEWWHSKSPRLYLPPSSPQCYQAPFFTVWERESLWTKLTLYCSASSNQDDHANQEIIMYSPCISGRQQNESTALHIWISMHSKMLSHAAREWSGLRLLVGFIQCACLLPLQCACNVPACCYQSVP